MKSYKGYEVTAINTNGFWYPYVSLNGKAINTGSDGRGFTDRDVAIAIAEAYVSLAIEDEEAGRCIHNEDDEPIVDDSFPVELEYNDWQEPLIDG